METKARRVTNVTENVCSVDRCSNPTFAHCINSMFSGKICEQCYSNNRPLWDKVHNQEIDDHFAKEES